MRWGRLQEGSERERKCWEGSGGVQRRVGGCGQGGPARWVMGKCRGTGHGAPGWRWGGVGWERALEEGQGRDGDVLVRMEVQGGSARSGTLIPSGGSARRGGGLRGGRWLRRAGLRGGGDEVVLLLGCCHGNFGVSRGASVPAAAGWLSWGRRSRLELIQGRRLSRRVPAAHRSTQEQGQPELCGVFTHVPTCDGNNLQMHRGGSSVTLRAVGMWGAAHRGDWCGSAGKQEWKFGIKAVPSVACLGRQVGIWES